jgi:hypothetical protein
MNTYSFSDVSVTISHPAVGQFIANGSGIGTITVSMATEKTVHDVAADGNVMVSKIKGRNGTVALAIQQVSEFQKWLNKWYNYLDVAPTDNWALTTIVIRAPKMGELTIASGVSPQKLPDKPYQAQGQQVTWNLMAADIQQDSL